MYNMKKYIVALIIALNVSNGGKNIGLRCVRAN